MTGSPSLLSEWIDHDFWNQGAFITSSDGEHITFGKGGLFSLSTKFEETKQPVFYLKDFYQDSYLVYRPSAYLTISTGHVLSWILGISDVHHHFSPISNDDDLYEKDYKLLMSTFKKGIQKVVLISRESFGPFEGQKTISHLLKRALKFGTGMPFGIWNKSYGMIGSTPEVLFDIKDNVLKTFALAGTAKIGEEEELLKSKKELHEHQLVVQDICEKLAPFITNLNIRHTGILPYKSIIHLKTEIEATPLGKIDLNQLTNSLSPTAALGGYPKKESLQFLKGSNYFQKYPQRYFGSAFGLISDVSQEFLVSIRNVQWDNQEIFIESGGGILPESDFEKELEEIQMKRNTIRKHYL
jgi:menaquinone-specific isochorismate synthase